MTRKLLFLLVIVSLLLVAAPAYTQTGPLSGKKICLDPGHGGSDPGAVNEEYDLEEADINLDVAYGLKSLLEGDGATVAMTRTDDSYKSNNDRYTFCNDEQATILVSVHTNSTTDPDMDGSLALYFHNDDQVLAQAIYDAMYLYLRDTAPDTTNFTDFGLDRFASGVLLKSDMPAAMMEPLFMSNPAEASRLATPIYLDYGIKPNPDCVECRRAQIAQAIYDGILSYFGAGGDSPPSVTITAPNDGDTVSGMVAVTANASDDDSVTQLEFFVDDDRIAVDADGSDGWSANWDTASAADGPHTVTATAKDAAGQTGSDSINVTVDNSGGSDRIALTATGYKVRGLQKADLAWSGATGTDVNINRDGVLIATTGNDGFYTDNIDKRGGGSYTYQVCETDGSTCSNEATVTF